MKIQPKGSTAFTNFTKFPSVHRHKTQDASFDIHVWRPKRQKSVTPAIIMFHGGGWMIGDIPMHRRFYSNIADTTNMVVISPEYRRSPEAGVPLAAYKKGS